jgi:xanthine dehydrogenase accessory factor
VVTDPLIDAVEDLVSKDEFGVVVTVIDGDDFGTKAVLDADCRLVAGLLPTALGDQVREDAPKLMARERSAAVGYESSEVFYEIVAPRPRLFIFGAVHIAQELIQHASLLGFYTIVSDPRPAFLTSERFPDADELRVGWPGDVVDESSFDNRTFVVVLTHDRRFEDPLWPLVLPTPVRYIGAMGSAKTTASRKERLLAHGFSADDVDRIHGPIGLDIGSRQAGETAIAILGEMISARYMHDEKPELVGKLLRA